MNEQCPIWKTPCETPSLYRGGYLFDSPRAGGRYIITPNAASKIYEWTEQEDILRAKLSRWIYEQNLLGALPEVTSQVLKEVEHQSEPPVSKRMDYLLEFINSEITTVGKRTSISEEMHAATLTSVGELRYLIRQAKESGWIEVSENQLAENSLIAITIKGYKRLEELRAVQVRSDQAFVAMWFDESMNEAWEKGFKPGIEDAGYKPLRIDFKQHNNKIDDEIIAEIKRSQFLVADFTSKPREARGGVYYEAGFAKGLNIPVIFTCRKDIFGPDNVHFDIQHFKHIIWDEPKDLRKELKKRISETIRDGLHRNNQKPT